MAELMAILLFISICAALMAGYPVAFTLAGVSLAFAGIAFASSAARAVAGAGCIARPAHSRTTAATTAAASSSATTTVAANAGSAVSASTSAIAAATAW